MDCKPVGPTVLVAGATGFLGTAIVRQLRGTSCRLRTSGRRLQPPVNLPNYSAADICDQLAVSRVVAGSDIIIHTAGLAHQHQAISTDSAQFSDTNAIGTENMVRAAAAAGCRRFIHVSSVAVYGSGWPPKTEKDLCVPKSAYARSKFEGEQRAAEIAASAGMELIMLRMATLYGENDPGNVGRLLKLIDRRRFIWIGCGENWKSLVHVDDAARACVAAALCGDLQHGSTYNVSAEPCTMRDIVSTLAANLGVREPALHLSAGLLQVALNVAVKIPGMARQAQRVHTTLEKWLSDEVYDGELFQRSFGWKPQVSLRDGLARQVAWYRATKNALTALDPHKSGLQTDGKHAA